MSVSRLPSPGANPAEALGFAGGFKSVEEEIRAVEEGDLEPIDIDVPEAVATVLGSLPEILALRGRFAELPGIELERIDKLRNYALALGHTHAVCHAAAPAAARGAAALRQRAFTLFLHAYDEARRAVTFLRWRQKDVDEIAPSLFVGPGGRRGAEAEADDARIGACNDPRG